MIKTLNLETGNPTTLDAFQKLIYDKKADSPDEPYVIANKESKDWKCEKCGQKYLTFRN